MSYNYMVQIQVRLCLLETSCEQADHFPAFCALKVNGNQAFSVSLFTFVFLFIIVHNTIHNQVFSVSLFTFVFLFIIVHNTIHNQVFSVSLFTFVFLFIIVHNTIHNQAFSVSLFTFVFFIYNCTQYYTQPGIQR